MVNNGHYKQDIPSKITSHSTAFKLHDISIIIMLQYNTVLWYPPIIQEIEYQYVKVVGGYPVMTDLNQYNKVVVPSSRGLSMAVGSIAQPGLALMLKLLDLRLQLGDQPEGTARDTHAQLYIKYTERKRMNQGP